MLTQIQLPEYRCKCCAQSFQHSKSEAAASPTGRGGLLPGRLSSPLADQAAQDEHRFAPRIEHPPRAKLKAAAPLPFAPHAAANAAQSATLLRACWRETCAPPAHVSSQFVEAAEPPHPFNAATSRGTARASLHKRATG
jgi:hypothetical protein